MENRVLVTGATGNVGGEVVRQLVAAGVPVRAMVRNRAKAAGIDHPGVEIVTGDFEKPETLGPALKGMSSVLLSSSPDPRQAELQNQFIDAARSAGRPNIVKVSAVG